MVLLAMMIQSEASSEPFQGKLAVAYVAMNRAQMAGQSLETVLRQPKCGINYDLSECRKPSWRIAIAVVVMALLSCGLLIAPDVRKGGRETIWSEVHKNENDDKGGFDFLSLEGLIKGHRISELAPKPRPGRRVTPSSDGMPVARHLPL